MNVRILLQGYSSGEVCDVMTRSMLSYDLAASNMSNAGKLAVIASFIISISVQPGTPITFNNGYCMHTEGLLLTQDGNSSAVLKDCLTLESQMIEIVQITTGSRP